MFLDLLTRSPEFQLCLSFLVLLFYATGPAANPVAESWWICWDSKVVNTVCKKQNKSVIPESLEIYSPKDSLMVSGPSYLVNHLTWWAVIWCLLGSLLVWNTPFLCIQTGAVFVRDSFTQGLCTVLLVYAALCLMAAVDWAKSTYIIHIEYVLLALLAVLGQHLLVMTTDLMGLYVCLELQSFSLVVLCSLNYTSAYAVEAGMKYFLLSAFSSCFLLLGIGLIYWDTGLTNLTDLQEYFTTLAPEWSLGALLGIWFVSLGLLWKLAAAPMHFWAADIYQGAWSSVSLLISTLPKLSVLGFWVHHWHSLWVLSFGELLGFFSAVSLLVGAIAPLAQIQLKRLLAFSSVGHMGFMLMALVGGYEGVAALWVYLALYLLTSLLIWSLLLWPYGRSALDSSGFSMQSSPSSNHDLQKGSQSAGPQYIWDLAGLNLSLPLAATAWAVAMLSLAGLPPVAGFLGKLGLFWWGLNTHQYILVAIALVSTLLGSVYYLRVLKVAYVDAPKTWGTYGQYSPVTAYIVAITVAVLVIALWHGTPLVLSSHLLSLVCSSCLCFKNLFFKK